MYANSARLSIGFLVSALWLAACTNGKDNTPGIVVDPGTAAGSGGSAAVPGSPSGAAGTASLPGAGAPGGMMGAGSGSTARAGAGGSAVNSDGEDGGTQDTDPEDSGPETVTLATECDAITTEMLALPDLEIRQTAAEAAGMGGGLNDYPSHCVIAGSMHERTGIDEKSYAIGFELRLPTEWNRRFLFQGGAGSDGIILPATGTVPNSTTNALSRGFAVVATDGGHTMELLPLGTGGAVFGLDPQARIDYGYNAVGVVTRAAKQIIERVYASPIARSYFMGCSNGGRQAMVAAARFGGEYDGIVAGNPGFNLPKAAIQHAWNVQQLNTIDTDNSDAFTAQELRFVAQKILDACDALDGASDGIVADFEGCTTAFDIGTEVPACAEGNRNGECLTSAQKRALLNMAKGPSNSRGEALYSDWPWDPSISTDATIGDWRAWNLGRSATDALIRTLGGASLAYLFSTPPVDLDQSLLGLTGDALGTFLSNYDFDVDAPKIHAVADPFNESAMSFMTPPNPTHLEEFRARRGKLIVYHGSGDPVFSLNDTVRWYKELSANVMDTPSFARLFVVPGMGHCLGGISTEAFDMLAPLTQWVEDGKAPESVESKVNPDSPNVPDGWSDTRSRPLCPYPQKATLVEGATDLESAASFICK